MIFILYEVQTKKWKENMGAKTITAFPRVHSNAHQFPIKVEGKCVLH